MAWVNRFLASSRSRSVAGLAVFTAVLLAAAGLAGAAARVGQQVDFKFTTLAGTTIGPRELKGKVVVISFWATWGKTAKSDAVRFAGLREEYAEKGVQLVSLSCDRSLDATKTFVTENKMTWTQAWDASGTLAQARLFGVTSIPRVVVLAPDGTFAWVGEPDKLEEALAETLEKYPYHAVDPKVVEAGRRVLEAAQKKLAAKDPAGALREMAKMPPETVKDKEFTAFADTVRAQSSLALAAEDVMEAANLDILQERYLDGARQLRDLSAAMGNTTLIGAEAGRKFERMLEQHPEVKQVFDAERRESLAAAALAEAQALRAAKKDDAAYAAFQQVAAKHAGTKAAEQAAATAKSYETDPVFQKRRADELAGKKAAAALKIARTYATAGRKNEAVKKYKSIVTEYPSTEWAKTAEAEMAKLK